MVGTIIPVENGAYTIKHRKVDVEVGDRNIISFKPKLKLKRWEGECFLEIGFQECEEEELEEETDVEGNITKLKWKVKTATFELELEYEAVEPRTVTTVVDDKEHSFLQNELGGLEFGIVLTKKPLVNAFSFPIKTEGLRFAYQPPLHPDHPTWVDTTGDGRADCLRPENVVGSYAVYHATRKKWYSSPEDAEKYKTGKAFHIYRPHLVDAIGNEAWADLDITDEILTITLPQQFLDEATYPITIDPDLGYTAIGGSTLTIAADGKSPSVTRRGSAWTMPVGGGTANYIKAYLQSSVADTVDCKVFINQKDSGGAGTHGQIATKENLACAAAAHWEQFDLADEVLTAGIVYIINIMGDSTDISDWETYKISYDENGATAVASYSEAATYATPESPWVINPEATKDYSIYCNYSVAAGWTGKISGVTDPAKVMGVEVANIVKVKGVE